MLKVICAILLQVALAAEAPITQVVGQAGDKVVTSREVQINYFAETTLFPDDKTRVSSKLDINDKNFGRELTHALIEWIVFKEAEIFNTSAVPEDDITKSISVIKSAVSNNDIRSYWDSLNVAPEELRDIVKRKLSAKKFIQFKTRASVVPVTDAEALQYFQKNRIRFGNAPFAQFKDSIKSLLAQDQANTRIRDWFELLQKKYRVRKVAVSDPNAKP